MPEDYLIIIINAWSIKSQAEDRAITVSPVGAANPMLKTELLDAVLSAVALSCTTHTTTSCFSNCNKYVTVVIILLWLKALYNFHTKTLKFTM